MASRWAAAGSELAVYPGGAHGVGHFGPHQHTALGKKAHQRIEAFIDGYLDGRAPRPETGECAE